MSKFEEIQRKVEQAQNEAQRAGGRLDVLKKELKEKFGVGSLKAAEELLADMEIESAKAEENYTAALTQFEADYGDTLDQLAK